MPKSTLKSKAIRAVLARRFAVAIGIVICVNIISLGAICFHAMSSQKDGHLINISGRQRMLSQRIALIASQLHSSETDDDRKELKEKLNGLISRMRLAHIELRNNSQTSATRSAIFNEPRQLNVEMDRYLDIAKNMVSSSDNDAAALNLSQLNDIAASDRFLAMLDDVVVAYESEYDGKISLFLWLLCGLAALGLLTTLSLIFLVFSPTVALVSSNLEALEESNEELNVFAYRISHDLRSPVIGALSISEITAELIDDNDIESAKTSLLHVKNSLAGVSEKIEDIIGLVRQKMIDVDNETFDLSNLVDESINAIRFMPHASEVEFSVSLPENLQLHTKKIYLRQSLENLLSNAVKYRDPHEAACHVKIVAEMEGELCRIKVADNGLGICENYHDRMFKMFQRFHPTISFGTGLGLYLISKNVVAINGSVKYRALDKGSEFEILFPTIGA